MARVALGKMQHKLEKLLKIADSKIGDGIIDVVAFTLKGEPIDVPICAADDANAALVTRTVVIIEIPRHQFLTKHSRMINVKRPEKAINDLWDVPVTTPDYSDGLFAADELAFQLEVPVCKTEYDIADIMVKLELNEKDAERPQPELPQVLAQRTEKAIAPKWAGGHEYERIVTEFEKIEIPKAPEADDQPPVDPSTTDQNIPEENKLKDAAEFLPESKTPELDELLADERFTTVQCEAIRKDKDPVMVAQTYLALFKQNEEDELEQEEVASEASPTATAKEIPTEPPKPKQPQGSIKMRKQPTPRNEPIPLGAPPPRYVPPT